MRKIHGYRTCQDFELTSWFEATLAFAPQSRTHVTYFSKISLIPIHYQKNHEIPILVKTQALECHQTPRILSNIRIIAHGH